MSVCYPLMTHISRVCLIFTVVAMVAATEPSGPEGGIEKGAEGGGVQLRRELGLWSAVSLIVGVMIGQCKNLMSSSIWCLSFATESVTIYLSNGCVCVLLWLLDWSNSSLMRRPTRSLSMRAAFLNAG